MPRKPTQLREKLIQTGLNYIEQYGVETISLRLIAEKCQVSHGSPYKYFKNKQDYLETVLAEIRLFLLRLYCRILLRLLVSVSVCYKWGPTLWLLLLNILTILTLSF